MQIYKCSDTTVNWFKSYLTNRKQNVSLNGTLSDKQLITCGVPQGSILGPHLFLLFINDLTICLDSTVSNTDMYADDTTIYDVNTSKTVIEQNLQTALNTLNTWCLNNGMVLNTETTKVL